MRKRKARLEMTPMVTIVRLELVEELRVNGLGSLAVSNVAARRSFHSQVKA